MNKKYAILFGLGNESYELLMKYKKYRPTLITIIGKEDDISPKVVKHYARLNHLKNIVIEQKDSYQDNIVLEKGNSKIEIKPNINPKILNQFDIIFSGRRRDDIIQRKLIPSNELPIQFKSQNNIICPFWNL